MTLPHSDGGRDDGEVGRFKTVLRTTVHSRLGWEIRTTVHSRLG